MAHAIETFGLTKKYQHQRGLAEIIRGAPVRETLALDNISLAINESEVFGLLGPNGSGKTTFLKLLSTVITPTSGSATVFGHDITTEDREVRRQIALVTGEERSLYWRLTARQNLNFFARLYTANGSQTRRTIDELLALFDLSHVADVRVSEYSTGMKQKLVIARGLLNTPRLLFLDEPTRGLDPLAAESLMTLLQERVMGYLGNTVILTTHIMREVEKLCQNVAILKEGGIVYSGRVDKLQSVLHAHDRYSIRVRRLPDNLLQGVMSTAGVMGCSRVPTENGLEELDLLIERDSSGLSNVLKYVLNHQIDVLNCSKREQSLEQLFRTVLDGKGPRREATDPAFGPAD
jgi:ABC-2 type transport system ATP-binding protein